MSVSSSSPASQSRPCNVGHHWHPGQWQWQGSGRAVELSAPDIENLYSPQMVERTNNKQK